MPTTAAYHRTSSLKLLGAFLWCPLHLLNKMDNLILSILNNESLPSFALFHIVMLLICWMHLSFLGSFDRMKCFIKFQVRLHTHTGWPPSPELHTLLSKTLQERNAGIDVQLMSTSRKIQEQTYLALNFSPSQHFASFPSLCSFTMTPVSGWLCSHPSSPAGS